MISALLLIAVAQADVDVQTAASPRATLDAEAATDLLAANSVNDNEGAGDTRELTAIEVGIRARVHATAFSGHAHFDFDYQGRQPITLNVQAADSQIHLLYKAEVSADFLDRLFFVGLGRFLAPSAVMLPVDGVRAQLHVGSLVLQVFGGRRAITTTRTGNVELKTFLPAGGGSVSLTLPRVQAELALTYSRDQVPLPTAAEAQQTFDAVSGYLRATARPFDWLALGAEVATAQRAAYLLGPTWSSLELHVRHLDLFYAVAFVELRPVRSLRIGYDFHLQNAQLYRDPELTSETFTPRFIDNRLRVKWRPLELGWVGVEVRGRVRPEWHEWRAGGNLELAPGWARGICLRASFTYEKMVQLGATLAPPDRSFWSASLGWRGSGLDVAVGASDVERSALPLSGRQYTPYNDTPVAPVDLSPFVLQAQRIVFLRAFYGSEIWLAGLDFEQSLVDGRERRLFVQLGARLEKEW